MIICKHCGQPISDKSKICPFCGGNVKVPFYDKTWFHILLVLIIFTGIDYVIRNPDPEPTVYRTPIVESADASSQSAVDPVEEIEEQETATKSEEDKYSNENIGDMIALVDNYPMQAEDYEGQYIRVSGYLRNVDSDGKYFTIAEDDDSFVIANTIQWNMKKSSDVYEFIKNASIGTYITVEGKITDVGEIMYYLGKADNVY